MRLQRVKIKNFKSVKDLGFDFPESGILVLVGENNSGKSNIIRAIDLICGEAWIGKEKLEDHDYYLRDKSNEIEIDLFFDTGNSVHFSPNNGKWGVSCFDDWNQQRINKFFQIKEIFPSTYLGADRTLDKHLSFYDWTLIGRIRKAFHKNVTDDLKTRLDAKFSELVEIFDQVPGFQSFKQDFSANYKALLPTFKTNLNVDFQPFTPSNYFKTMQIMGIDPQFADKPLDLSELGEGARNLILIALLKSFAKNFKNHGGALSGILALEEPELFLHPQARRHLFKELRGLAEEGMQIIISTHSDSFIDTEFFDEIGRVVKVEDDEHQDKLQTQLITCSKQVLVDKCLATGVPEGKATLESITEYYRTTSNYRLNEGFFSRCLILVEGETEEMAFPELLSEFDIDCDSMGISIIGVNGKNQIPKYWRLYSQFQIPIIVVFDDDNTENSNNNLAACFGIDPNEILVPNGNYFKTMISTSLPNTEMVVMKKDFETAIKYELEQLEVGFYDQLDAEAKDLIKPIRNQQKGTVARYIVRNAKLKEGFNSDIGLTLAKMVSSKL
ncbi:MAG: AAA family ATPase [Bacteroidia bacterium]|nr:AAA family ATPase [Bacteroidia bacterium]